MAASGQTRISNPRWPLLAHGSDMLDWVLDHHNGDHLLSFIF